MMVQSLKPALLAVALALTPGFAGAETLRVIRGNPASAITLAPGAEISVETVAPFVELAIANPGIAEPMARSDRQVALTGRREGWTTLTLLHDPHARSVSQVDILVTSESASQDPSVPVPLPATPEPQVIPVGAGGEVPEISVDVNQSLVLKTDSPFADVAIDDASHADYAVLSSVGVYLIGKRPGTAKLTLLRQGNGSDTVLRISVK